MIDGGRMANLTVTWFPLFAVLISVYAYFCPELLQKGGFLVVPLLGFIMLGMGATLSVKDFISAIRRPKAVVIGLFMQFALMPFLAFAIGHLLQLPREQFIGLVMVGTVAGGTASNVITYLAGGDVALSITMTACSTVAGIVLTPLFSSFLLKQTVDVPAWAMFKSILMVVALPVTLGLVINRLMKKKERLLANICPLISAFGIVLVIGIIMALNRDALRQCGWQVFAAVVCHNLSGVLLGYSGARALRCDKRTAITVAIETGMQNSGLAVALTKQFFSIGAALPGAIFSVWHNISGALFAIFTRLCILK